MEKIKTYRYPLWLRILMRIVQLMQLGILLAVSTVMTIMLITLSQWGLSLFGLLITGALGICFIAFFISFYLASFLAFPNVDIKQDQIRIRNLFLSSDWFAIEEITGVEYKFLMRDPTGYAEKILVETLGIYRLSLVVESDKLPRLSRWNRVFVGKKNAVFLIGERIDGFDELKEILERGQE